MSRRGPKGKWTGFKLAFLQRLGSEIGMWRAEGQVGKLLDRAVNKFFATYGFTAIGPFSINPAVDPSEQDEEDEAVAGCRTQEEADLHAKRTDELRDIFSNWFRHHFPVEKVDRVGKTSKPDALDAGPLGKLLGGATKAPYKRGVFAHYQDKYFATRVSSEYKRRWEAELSTWKSHTEQMRLDLGLQRPVSIRTITNTCLDLWKNESKEFRDAVAAESEAYNQDALKRYELGLTVAKTPLDYHNQLTAISQHLQPIADVIAAQTGSDVTIFLVGPIPSRQGQLEARSISATRPGAGASAKGWVHDDPEGVTRTEERLVDYAKGHFTNAECVMRSLPRNLVPKEHDSEADAMAGLEVITHFEEADQGGGDEKRPEFAATPMMQDLLASAEADLTAIESETDFATTTKPAVTPRNAALTPLSTTPNGPVAPLSTTPNGLITPLPMSTNGPVTLFSLVTPLSTTPNGLVTPLPTSTNGLVTPLPTFTNGIVTPLPSSTNPVTTGTELPVPVLAPGSNFQDDDSDGEETPIVKPWQLSIQRSRSSSVAALDMDNSTDFIIDADTTLKQLMASVAPPPLVCSKHKVAPAASTLAKTFSRPGFVPGRRNRPESSIPPRILQSLTQAPRTDEATHPAPQHFQPSAPVDVTPNYIRWPATECATFKWLVSDTEGWGNWVPAVRLLMDFREKTNFPDHRHRKFTSPAPNEITEWMKSTVRLWRDVSIGDVDSFAIQYRGWWQVIQPTERSQCNAPILPIPLPSMDWTALQRPGVNGLVLFVVALRWWGIATDASASWRAEAQDFYLAMQCIYRAASHSSSGNSLATTTTTAPLGPFSFPPLSTQRSVPPNPDISMAISSDLAAAVGESSSNELMAAPVILPAKPRAAAKSRAPKPPSQGPSTRKMDTRASILDTRASTRSMSALKSSSVVNTPVARKRQAPAMSAPPAKRARSSK